jgi:hypothetical protein
VKKYMCLVMITIACLLSSCATLTPIEKGKPETGEAVRLMYIEGVVQEISGNELLLELKLPQFKKTSEDSIGDIVQEVVQKSLFPEGTETVINGVPAKIKESMGRSVRVLFEKPVAYPVGTAIKLKYHRKTLAVVDFEVIKGNEKAIGRVTQEALTSALIQSEHFIIVERSKLKAIMTELQLSVAGLTKESPDSVLGKLIMADLILTGTLVDLGTTWDVNLRLVNVRTGQAMSSILKNIPIIKPLKHIGVSLPSYKINKPASTDPPAVKQLLGIWVGNWGGLDSVLIVYDVDVSAKKAKIIYVWGDKPELNIKKGYIRTVAEFGAGDRPTIKWGKNTGAVFEFVLRKGELEGTRIGGDTSTIIMMKAP